MTPIVFYHANCTDGFGAAYAAWTKLGDEAEYVPMHYNNPIAHPTAGRDVYVLDFSFPKDVTNRLIEESSKFVWLDHHQSAFEMWCDDGERERCEQSNGKDYVLLDNNKSGALLAWEYFNPGSEVPLLSQMIDDRDRWQFKLRGSKEFHAGVNMRPFSFREWHLLTPMGASDWGRNLNDVMGRGRATLDVYHKQTVESVRKAERCSLPHMGSVWMGNGRGAFTKVPSALPAASRYTEDSDDGYSRAWFDGLAVNTPNNISEVGHELATASGTFGLVWYYDAAAKKANCSLRSNGDYDVSAIAKQFGGGGHKNAAGFQVGMNKLLEWLK
jgi:oligoribonuclease NrnB/cAMP/cGMP phosphodiesterase (DHH superfamily)